MSAPSTADQVLADARKRAAALREIADQIKLAIDAAKVTHDLTVAQEAIKAAAGVDQSPPPQEDFSQYQDAFLRNFGKGPTPQGPGTGGPGTGGPVPTPTPGPTPGPAPGPTGGGGGGTKPPVQGPSPTPPGPSPPPPQPSQGPPVPMITNVAYRDQLVAYLKSVLGYDPEVGVDSAGEDYVAIAGHKWNYTNLQTGAQAQLDGCTATVNPYSDRTVWAFNGHNIIAYGVRKVPDVSKAPADIQSKFAASLQGGPLTVADYQELQKWGLYPYTPPQPFHPLDITIPADATCKPLVQP